MSEQLDISFHYMPPAETDTFEDAYPPKTDASELAGGLIFHEPLPVIKKVYKKLNGEPIPITIRARSGEYSLKPKGEDPPPIS